jgi:integrase
MAGKQVKILSDRDLKDLLAYASFPRYPQRNTVIVLLSVKAGLRAGEIAKLTWEMVSDSRRPTKARTENVAPARCRKREDTHLRRRFATLSTLKLTGKMTCRKMAGSMRRERRRHVRAYLLCDGTTRAEPASTWRINRAGRLADEW